MKHKLSRGIEWVKRHWALVFVLTALSGGGVVAQSRMVVDQGQPGRYGPWPVTVVGSSPVLLATTLDGGSEYVQSTGHALNVVVTSGGGTVDYSPGVPATVTLAANTAGSICSLTGGSRYRITCGTAAQYRTGAATPVAVATDSDLFANGVQDVTLKTTETCFSFISAGSPTCKASLIAP